MPIICNMVSFYRFLRGLLSRDYWTLCSVFGTILIAIAGFQDLSKYRTALLATGGGFLLLGLLKAAQRNARADLIEEQNRDLAGENGSLEEKIRHFRDKRIFLVTADLSEVQWQVRFVRQILFGLRQRDYRVDTYVPSSGFDANEQDGHLARVLQSGSDYEGGIVISMFSERRREAIEAFARELRLPLVVVDNIEHPAIEQTCYVGVKSSITGQLAGKAALDMAQIIRLDRILVVAGREQVARQEEFRRVVLNSLPKCDVDIHTDGEFRRAAARQITLKWVDYGLKHRCPYQLIFCTSDQMTLGCIDALNELSRSSKAALPLVIGHDGELAVLYLLGIDDPYLSRVVVTSPEKMAEDVVDSLYGLLSKPGSQRQPRWAEPYLEPNKLLPR